MIVSDRGSNFEPELIADHFPITHNHEVIMAHFVRVIVALIFEVLKKGSLVAHIVTKVSVVIVAIK